MILPKTGSKDQPTDGCTKNGVSGSIAKLDPRQEVDDAFATAQRQASVDVWTPRK